MCYCVENKLATNEITGSENWKMVDPKQFFQEATVQICGSLEIEKAMANTLRFLSTVLPADSMTLHLYRGDLGAMKILGYCSLEETRKLNYTVSLSSESIKLAEWPQRENVKFVNSPRTDAVMEQIGQQTGLFGPSWNLSHLIMRLNIEGNRIADVAIQARGEGRYNERHAQLYSLLNEPIGIAMSNHLRFAQVVKLKNLLADENDFLKGELLRLSGDGIVGAEGGLKSVMGMVRLVARLDTPVLILGETGVGKEMVANVIQHLSPRKNRPFIKVNCGAIPDSLVDSELFGHEKGAFTGAVSTSRGRFERADGGTIFLDEIGDLPPQAQVRLLRVLQNGEMERVGGASPIILNIRVVAATNRDLRKLVDSGQFREDLFYRLNVFPILIPPLRQRKEDIPALVDFFIEKKALELKLDSFPVLKEGVWEQLSTYEWPGNVRELENLVERSLIINRSGPLSFKELMQLELGAKAFSGSWNAHNITTLDQAMTNHIQKALQLAKGKVQGPGGAAELLNVNSNTLRKRMKKLGIPFGRSSYGSGQGI